MILQLAGLTRFALTVIGGTGVAGIIFGFAFRDIAERFFASMLLSIRRPFHTDDFVLIDGLEGIVQQMNTRSTVLMTRDGNHVQIPDATVFKNTIVNMSSSRNTRGSFDMSVGSDHSIKNAQRITVEVLEAHDAILAEPAPMVLVETLHASSITLRAYYGYDMHRFSPLKLRSALVRHTLRALEAEGISAPDDAREVILPQGVPLVERTDDASDDTRSDVAAESEPESAHKRRHVIAEDGVVEHADEGGLASEEHDLRRQARAARSPEGGAKLLDD
ncbi:MAG: mechanosensitive ion channel domain-containing protein [Pseudomonadota bacterium]